MKKMVLCLAIVVLMNASLIKAMDAGAGANDGSQTVLHRDGGVLLNNLTGVPSAARVKEHLEKRQDKKLKPEMTQSEYDLELLKQALRTFQHDEAVLDLEALGLASLVQKVRLRHVLELVEQEKKHPGSVEEFAELPPHTLTNALKKHTDLPPETIAFLQERVNTIFVDNLAKGVKIAADTHTFELLQNAALRFHQLPTAIQTLIKDKAGITSPTSPKEGTDRWLTARKAITFGSGVAVSAAASAGLMFIKSKLGF